jgi:hypothetical protein
MEKPFIEIDAESFSLSQVDIHPPDGHELPVNSESGNAFPLCCAFHTKLSLDIKKWYEKFPLCCDGHTKMAEKEWFEKQNYAHVPEKVLRQISFTEYVIKKEIHKENWYKLITDYLEFNVMSFGHPAIGLHLYLGPIRHWMIHPNKNEKDITAEKRSRILEFINEYYSEPKGKRADLNLLFSTYQKWLKVFPFETPYFRELKQYFENQLPFIDGKVNVNMYSGVAKVKLHTQSELVEVLTDLTKKVLSKVSVEDLLKNKLVTDLNEHKLKLVRSGHRLAQSALLNSYSRRELGYIKLLKKWIANEKKYFDEMVLLLDNSRQETNKQKFLPVDEGRDIFKSIPFEIALVYKYSYPQRFRFIRVEGEDYYFYTASDLYYNFKEAFLKGRIYIDEDHIADSENIRPFYKAYAAGFFEGYNQLDQIVEASTRIFREDPNSVVNKVFEYINKSIPGLASYGGAFEKNGEYFHIVSKELWYNVGCDMGKQYKAWYYIVNNPKYFVDLFKTHPVYIEYYNESLRSWKSTPGGEGMVSQLKKLLASVEENRNLRKEVGDVHLLIKSELIPRLELIESKIPEKIAVWKLGQDKIQCAGFCELLYEKLYFIKKIQRIKSINSFALSRYGIDIKIQLAAAKKTDRQSHIRKFKRLFE